VRIAVVGTGLIGGSVGMAARRRLDAEVRGCGPEAPRAVQLGAIDIACATVEEALDDAEVAFVATPLGVLTQTVSEVLTAAPADCVVTDNRDVALRYRK
jgi:prephenate dehydrogenase